MAKVANMGITHIIDMQIEFDDTPLGLAHGIEVLWNPMDDDFEPPSELLRRGVEFAHAALEDAEAKLFIHSATGAHRAPTMALAVLGSMGWNLEDAMQLIEGRRPEADFAGAHVRSVGIFLGEDVDDAEIVVEYHFRCFCGATIAATENEVTCATCGKELAIRRFKRQHWKIAPPQRPYRKLQVEDLGVLMNRILSFLLLLGLCLLFVFLLRTVPVRTW
ncbi:MAG: dual specificity protein phosphatase [Candidatus Sulfotelmatobacter sp.]